MDWRYNTIWIDQIAEEKVFIQDFKKKTKSSSEFNSTEYAFLSYLKKGERSFGTMDSSDKLLHLQLDWANISNLEDIGKFPNLKRLELHYRTKLESESGIENLCDSLRFLHINQSKKFTISDKLLKLKNLRVLCLNSCGPIDTLEFLTEFENLVDFRFVDTNILSGDLKPIFDHPNIRTVGFLNKKHYNYTVNEVDRELSLKSRVDFKKYVSKGDFKTYRYEY